MRLTRLRCSTLPILTLLLTLSPARADPPPADTAPVARWPEKAGTGGHVFGGSEFLALNPAPNVGDGPCSIAVWVNPADLAGGNPTYGRGIARSTRGEKVGDWFLSVHPDGRLRFSHWRQEGEDAKGSHVTRDPLIVLDAWSYVVATWDGKTYRLFVNGAEAGHNDVTSAKNWLIGHEVGRSWTDPTYYWDGAIDDLRVYRRALDAAEVAAGFKVAPQRQLRTAAEPAGDPKVSRAIDQFILANLKEHSLTPAPPADDAEFHRRVMLDLASRIPTPAEAEAFLRDTASDKRPKLIETLLAGREMPIAWAQVLSGWLMPKEGRRDPLFLAYLRTSLARNQPWDRLARELVVARPEGPTDQAATLFLGYRKTALTSNAIARDIGQAFFGVNLRCAQCHDHPHVAEWTQERFYGLSAFFARTYEHPYTDAQNQKRTVFAERGSGDLEYTAEGKKRVAALVFLDGTPVTEPPLAPDFKEAPPPKNAAPPDPPFSRREALARVALGPKSTYFTRAVVNRVWKRLLGRGLIEPVDLMHSANLPTHPELLDLLAEDFATHGCNLRRLIAVIAQSETYARSSRWPGTEGLPDETRYAVAALKPLDADQLALALPLATGYYDAQLAAKRTMAQLRTGAPWKEVLVEFDTDSDEFEPTTAQALFLTNSTYVQTHFVAKSSLAQALSVLPDDAELARRAYLAVLSRVPAAEEIARVSRHLKERGAKARAEACRELVWALLSGAEFRFNH